MMFIDNKYELGQEVYLKTDPDQHKRIVVRIIIAPTGLLYELNSINVSSWHYEFEITSEKVFAQV